MNKIALIPSYEPDYRLIDLIKELKYYNFDIVVVDDGSGEKYKKIFDNIKPFITLIKYDENKGKGHALKTGLNYIKKNYSNYIVVTMDSDGQHTVKDAIKLCEYAKYHKSDLVIGRRTREKSVPLRSRLGNGITKFVYNIVAHANIYDTQTGLRCFSYKLTNFLLNVEGDRYEYEMNMLLKASKKNITIKEVDIETIYIDNNKGSHFKTLKDSYLIYKEIIKFSLSSIGSFITDLTCFTVFNLLFKNITVSNILARVISSNVNFAINRKMVFKSEGNLKKEMKEYFSLVILILLLNTILLNLLVSGGINIYVAKIITEVILFLLSYTVEKYKIFRMV